MPEREYILVTGASGFLGRWLADAVHAEGFGLLGLDIVDPLQPKIFSGFAKTPCEKADFAALIGDRKLYAVFHFAGGASVPQSVGDPVGDFNSLLPGTVALLDHLARHQRDAHLVFPSSAAVYGNPTSLPVIEKAAIIPISPYGIHKAAAEFIIGHYARLFGLRASVLRIFSAYGEGLRKQVVWDLCRKILTAHAAGESAVSMHGHGSETRDFIHAADIARAALLVAARPPSETVEILNVGSGIETSIRSLAQEVLRVLGRDIEITFDGISRLGDPANWRADISPLRNLGFVSHVSFEDGIGRAARWCQQQIHTTH
jgi:UDP-glucose 4-epimerase